MHLIAAIWGTLGVCTLLLSAILRLAPRALEALRADLTTLQWVTLIGFALFMVVAEGYRGFQKKFSPRTAARVQYLYHNTTPIRLILAPLFCMGYFHATKKTKIVAYALTFGIIGLILLVSLCPFPWRGIIDFGVVLGLSYGLLSFLAFVVKVFSDRNHNHSPEVP